MRILLVAIVAIATALAATPPLDIQLAHGTPAEAATRTQLERIAKQYDLEHWIWTRTILVDADATPHSHPVLTVHTRNRSNDVYVLSTLVHEQLHWYETAHPEDTRAAMADLRLAYPKLPVGGTDGAADEESSYLHVIVCYMEFQAMKALVGDETARKTMEFWATDHYRAIYRLILSDEQAVGAIVNRHNLRP
jgi:hypothetical protein